MITFGYKTKFSSILRALAAVGVGLIMIFGNNAPVTVVKLIACFMLASGIVTFLYGIYKKRQDGSSNLMSLNALTDILIGLLLFLNPQWIAGFIVSIIGIVLLIFGALQLLVLATSMAFFGGRFPSLFLSIAAVLGGVFLIVNPLSLKIMSIVAGILLVVYGVSELLSTWKVAKAKTEYEIRFPSDSGVSPTKSPTLSEEISDAKEAEFEKID